MTTKATPWAGRDPRWTDPQKDFLYWGMMKAPKYPKNERIQRHLWAPQLEVILREGVKQLEWWYGPPTLDRVIAALDPDAQAAWQADDPLCKEYWWTNVLMAFIDHQAWDLGLRHEFAPPGQRSCRLCDGGYLESSVHRTFASRLRYRANPFCGACSSAIRQYACLTDRASVLTYVRELHAITGVVPPPDFGMDYGCVAFMDWDDIARILVLLRKGCPNPDFVKSEFGTWFAALDAAGLLPAGIRVTSRGYQCLAKDGHLCLSMGERTIDDFLHEAGIDHEREPRYPFGRHRADFKVGATLIEYAGLGGEYQYDERLAMKVCTARSMGIPVLVIFREDLTSLDALRRALAPVI